MTMTCIACGGHNVQWQGPMGRLTHTKCLDCGEIDCHAGPRGTQEGERCNRDHCRGILSFAPVENCTCFINQPCGACTSNPLQCGECGWVEEAIL